jgi:hypothetical protein
LHHIPNSIKVCNTLQTGFQLCWGKLRTLQATRHWSSFRMNCFLEYLTSWFYPSRRLDNGPCLTSCRVRICISANCSNLTAGQLPQIQPNQLSLCYLAFRYLAVFTMSLSQSSIEISRWSKKHSLLKDQTFNFSAP